ncbi:MAG: BrnA antitoxin family protein [Candidatus Berkelbacteria bacterium]
MKKEIPKFEDKNEEEKFWQENDSADFLDWRKARSGNFPNLKPTLRLISIRLPQFLIDELKVEANRLDIPYQSLIKKYLDQSLRKEKSRAKVCD